MLTSKQCWQPIDGPDDERLHRNICYGGGGGSGTGNPPDYSQYISAMTAAGNTGLSRASDLYSWAQQQGLDLKALGQRIGGAAETAATGQQGTSDKMMADWQTGYDPLYASQRADATRMGANLPQTEESYAGKFGADTAQGIDQQLAAEQRKQQSMGISPGVASTALDTQARIGRAAATTAAAEQGRLQARTEARNVTGQAIQTGQFIPGVAGQQAGLATANRGQAASVPMTAASTSAGLYSPSLGYYSAAQPYMKAWGDTMATSYNQNLAASQQRSEQDDGGFMSTILPLAGGIAGSFFGPMGSAVGSSIGKAAGSAITQKTGGKVPANGGRRIPRYAQGGAIDTGPPTGGDGNYIPPEASPSGGQNVDDVHAMVSAGEFVIPERTVDWYGEKFFQNLITKADGEAQQQTVAAPEEAPPEQQGAINMMPPQFRSEGARA
jgi:hypothetical protein